MRQSAFLLLAIAGLATGDVAAARSGQPTGSVRGTVAVAGHPLPTAKVSLHPEGGKAISTRVEDGDFAFESVPTGAFRVSVAEEGLASRYADPATSGLSVKVKAGSNEVRLELVVEGIEVGRPAPHLPAHGPDGNILRESDLRGKLVLLAFWYAGPKDPATEAQFDHLREIRREFAGGEKLLIISMCVNAYTEEGAEEAWNRFVIGQGAVDYGDGRRRFIDDSRWWQCTDIAGIALPSAHRYGVGRKPEAFLIDTDGRFVAVRIPARELRREVASAIGRAPSGRGAPSP